MGYKYYPKGKYEFRTHEIWVGGDQKYRDNDDFWNKLCGKDEDKKEDDDKVDDA